MRVWRCTSKSRIAKPSTQFYVFIDIFIHEWGLKLCLKIALYADVQHIAHYSLHRNQEHSSSSVIEIIMCNDVLQYAHCSKMNHPPHGKHIRLLFLLIYVRPGTFHSLYKISCWLFNILWKSAKYSGDRLVLIKCELLAFAVHLW